MVTIVEVVLFEIERGRTVWGNVCKVDHSKVLNQNAISERLVKREFLVHRRREVDLKIIIRGRERENHEVIRGIFLEYLTVIMIKT